MSDDGEGAGIYYVREKSFKTLKTSLKDVKKEIGKAEVEALFTTDGVAGNENMIPVDFACLPDGPESFENIEALVAKLKPKGAAETLVKARDLFEANPEKEEDEERPQPMSMDEWRECLEMGDSDEEDEEDDDDDEDDGALIYIREKIFNVLKGKVKGSITKEEAESLTQLEDIPDDENMIPVDMTSLEECANLGDADEIIEKLGAKGFVEAIVKARALFEAKLPDAKKEDVPQPMTAKDLREVMEDMDMQEGDFEGEEEELGLDDEDDEDEDDDEDDEEVEEPPKKKAKA